MKTISIIRLALAGIIVTLSLIIPLSAQGTGQTSNELAAKGPFPGEVSLYTKELACSQRLPTPGYYSSLNGAEISDSERSGTFPCATFIGSWDGPNQVFAWRSADDYQGISYINNRRPGELYVVGGEYPTPADPLPAGPYVAKVDATTGKEIWRTYVDNQNVSGRFIGNSNLNILENGNIPQAWSNQIVLIDSDTGLILKHSTLPTGDTPAEDVNYKHVTVAPDGTLILKHQSRPIGCKVPGTMGIIKCSEQGMEMPNSNMVAIHPDTLEVLDFIALPEPAASPHIVTTYKDKIAIYLGMTKSAARYFWDPQAKKFSVDDNWVAHPLKEGQTAMTAPSIIGDWVGFQTNGLFSNKSASSVVVIHRDDAERKEVIFPFGDLEPGEWSFAPPKAGADPENNMIYSADMGMGKVAGIKIDPVTGKLEVAFVIDAISNTFQPVMGPKDQRVLLLTNIKLPEGMSVQEAIFSANKYTEQLTWRDAGTGRILAESDFFEPLTVNSLTPPGFGGRVYFPTAIGKGFYVLQVMPKAPQSMPADN